MTMLEGNQFYEVALEVLIVDDDVGVKGFVVVELQFIEVAQTGFEPVFLDDGEDFVNDGGIVGNVLK